MRITQGRLTNLFGELPVTIKTVSELEGHSRIRHPLQLVEIGKDSCEIAYGSQRRSTGERVKHRVGYKELEILYNARSRPGRTGVGKKRFVYDAMDDANVGRLHRDSTYALALERIP